MSRLNARKRRLRDAVAAVGLLDALARVSWNGPHPNSRRAKKEAEKWLTRNPGRARWPAGRMKYLAHNASTAKRRKQCRRLLKHFHGPRASWLYGRLEAKADYDRERCHDSYTFRHAARAWSRGEDWPLPPHTRRKGEGKRGRWYGTIRPRCESC